jgi:hypothetical protein
MSDEVDLELSDRMDDIESRAFEIIMRQKERLDRLTGMLVDLGFDPADLLAT